MNLSDIKGTYNAIFSLGDLCLASLQLQRRGLRPYSGVLDWIASLNLSDVSRLLQNRFVGFMEMPNLRIIGYATDKYICVSDDAYHMVSNHDFETTKNSLYHLGGYPEVKQKYDRRINRFLEKVNTCKRILFVRTEGTYDEALELQSVLSDLVKHDFRVLIVNHAPVMGVVEQNWPLEKVCAIELPNFEKWEGNNYLWDQILQGIHISA